MNGLSPPPDHIVSAWVVPGRHGKIIELQKSEKGGPRHPTKYQKYVDKMIEHHPVQEVPEKTTSNENHNIFY